MGALSVQIKANARILIVLNNKLLKQLITDNQVITSTAWAMDLLVPCIVEGRSELRNVSRVNCKTQWLIFELRITLLTERISHYVAVLFGTLQCAWLSAHCFYNTDFVCKIFLFCTTLNLNYTFLHVKYVILYINLYSYAI